MPGVTDAGAHDPLFVLVAGEASGDQLGAGLIAALRARWPGASFAGIGGERMVAAGLTSWHPLGKLSVMGLVEVLGHLPGLLAIRRDVIARTLALRPDAFIGIDAPDFNLGVERRLKCAGIRTAHYVSPSIWAWRAGRAARMARCADRVLCLFPMEPPIYARHGVAARFVGHPLADAFAQRPDQAAARRALGLPLDAPLLALLPGSRLGEVKRLARDFIEAAAILKNAFPGLKVVAPMANAACRAAFEASRPAPRDVSIIDGQAHAALVGADAVLVASGTASLEAMLAKRPMVVAYRLAPLTHFIVKSLGLLRAEHYALPNILAGRAIVPELMQDACTPQALAAQLLPMLRERGPSPELLADYARLHDALRGGGSAAAAAEISALAATPAESTL